MEIQISQDIRKFKTKDIGNFSFKEIGFIILGFGLAFIIYKLTDSIGAAVPAFIIIAALAFLKPHGMTSIQYIKTVGKERLSPSVYINETDYEYDNEFIENEYGKEYKVNYADTLTQSNSANIKQKLNIYEEDLIVK